MADIVKLNWADGDKLDAADLNTNFTNLLNSIFVFNEDKTSLTDGSTTTFATAFKALPGTLRVFLEGNFVRKDASSETWGYYSENVDGSSRVVSITMSVAPTASQDFVFNYTKSNDQT
jgi:hypothetical protein